MLLIHLIAYFKTMSGIAMPATATTTGIMPIIVYVASSMLTTSTCSIKIVPAAKA